MRASGLNAIDAAPIASFSITRWQFLLSGLTSCYPKRKNKLGRDLQSPSGSGAKGQNDWHLKFPRIPLSHELDPLVRLMLTLKERAETRPTGSYTTKLMEGGAVKIGSKIREEADELIEAAGEEGDAGREHFIYEAGDLIYHTMVMLAFRGVELSEVADELARREGTSGLLEKANRSSDSNTK